MDDPNTKWEDKTFVLSISKTTALPDFRNRHACFVFGHGTRRQLVVSQFGVIKKEVQVNTLEDHARRPGMQDRGTLPEGLNKP